MVMAPGSLLGAMGHGTKTREPQCGADRPYSRLARQKMKSVLLTVDGQ